jgi:hypothetical protein
MSRRWVICGPALSALFKLEGCQHYLQNIVFRILMSGCINLPVPIHFIWRYHHTLLRVIVLHVPWASVWITTLATGVLKILLFGPIFAVVKSGDRIQSGGLRRTQTGAVSLDPTCKPIRFRRWSLHSIYFSLDHLAYDIARAPWQRNGSLLP